ncbi:alpha/beta hydrolase [Rhodocytophaga aerolata]|uniref:Alpha/beta hydrolase n=1 Tax=Rhodocytophaga aerolata TaxID=455078 RepID=A0ABT8RG78_9BACT|nr:alpha/beta hydrolase [Rhodocytophaga aerolata]MDO1451117.1 alpha/beta hydrolase [Rhodocytophaga aerolata]
MKHIHSHAASGKGSKDSPTQAITKRQPLSLFVLAKAAMLLLLLVSACVPEIPGPLLPIVIKPKGPKPSWAPTIDPQMQAIIEELDSFGTPPLHELTPGQAREAPTPTDAVKSLIKEKGLPLTQPDLLIDHKVIPGPSPQGVLVRIYTPKKGAGPFPVIVYYHGGGWVIANLDTYDPSARALSDKVGAIVVSVAYRQGPEHPFPAAHEDSFAAYKWVVENAASINGDPSKIATAGESAGGNLAVAVSLMAKERSLPLPVHILSVYPIADEDLLSPSYEKYANAKPLSRPLMEWFFNYYKPNWKTNRHRYISLIHTDLTGLSPTTIINAEIDPLESDGAELAKRLQNDGVMVMRKVYKGVTHEFFGMSALLEQAQQAQAFATTELKKAFE